MERARPEARPGGGNTLTTTLILAVVLAIVVIAAVALIGRAWRNTERRERALIQLMERQENRHVDVLDRVLYAAGKPWKDSADRPDTPADREQEAPAPILEDPPAGADYESPYTFYSDLEDVIYAGDDATSAPEFDTRTLEVM